MHPEETGRSYDQIAEDWLQPHLETNGIRQVERAIAFARNRGHALDVGCGCSGRFEKLLTNNGFEVEGVDISSRMIELARQQFPSVTFHHADISTWKIPRQYDVILAWDSIWHLPLGLQPAVMEKICGALTAGGVFVFTAGGLDEPDEKADSAMGPPVYYSTLGIPQILDLLGRSGCVCRHLEYDQFPKDHLLVIAQKAG